MTYYRYSLWDGTQQFEEVGEDDLMNELAEYLMSYGNLADALRMMLRQGIRTPRGQRLQGIQDLLEQLRQRKRQQLDRYDLSSVFKDLQEKLDRLLAREREGLQQRLDQAQSASGGPEGGEAPDEAARRALENIARRK